MTNLTTNLIVLQRSRDKTTAALTVIAIALPHAVFLAVLGGVLMFRNRLYHPANEIMSNGPHLALALFAATLLIVPALSMGASAARLGLSRKAKQLATLRLLGITPGQARQAAVADTLLQASIGIILGSVIYALTLPIWTVLSFQGVTIAAAEMWMGILPLLAAGIGMLILTGISGFAAMQKVAITPLGVLRKNQTTRVNIWGIILVAAFFAGWFTVAPLLMQLGTAIGLTVILGFFGVGIALMNVLGVIVIASLGKVITRFSTTAEGVLAGRRLIAEPKAIWRSFGALGLISFMVGVLVPGMHAIFMTSPEAINDPFGKILFADIYTGLLLTMLISTVLAAVSTAVQQAIRALDSAGQREALIRMGAPYKFWLRARRREVALPAIVIIGGNTVLGIVFASPLAAAGNVLFGFMVVGLSCYLALLLVLIAAESARILEK